MARLEHLRRAALLLLGLVAFAASPLIGIQFREVAEEWGLDFRHRHGGSGERYMVETMAGGVVLFDYDGDGDVDVLFVDGGTLPGYQGPTPRTRLFRNDGGRFVEVTEGAGIQFESYGFGGTAADYDGDGCLDLYLTAFGANRLLRNRCDGTFEDVTERAGAGDERWSASAAFADLTGDGWADLYVVNYVDFSVDNHRFCGDEERGIQGYCHPEVYNGLPDRLFRNRGDGSFEDATAAAGLGGAVAAGLGVVIGDLTGDGRADVYVANDLDPNFLFRNRGDGTFEDISLVSGTAASDRGNAEAGMGVDLGDYDGDGQLDIVVTNFELETNALYRNVGDGLFVDSRWPAGIAEPSLRSLGFGVAFADFDQDGWLDLVVANGHIHDNAEELSSEGPYRQRNQLFRNRQGRFRAQEATGLDVVRASRGLAVGDLTGDGRLDLVVVNVDDLAEVYQNVTDPTGAWLQVDLAGPPPNRFGLGARVEVSSERRAQVREVRTASSYLSQSSLTLHFGVGQASRVDALSVRWSDGKRQRFSALPVDRRVRLHHASAGPAVGFESRASSSARGGPGFGDEPGTVLDTPAPTEKAPLRVH